MVGVRAVPEHYELALRSLGANRSLKAQSRSGMVFYVSFWVLTFTQQV
jgi:hypothetical protein